MGNYFGKADTNETSTEDHVMSIKDQISCIIRFWVREVKISSPPIDIVYLIVDTYTFQPVFEAVHQQKLNNQSIRSDISWKGSPNSYSRYDYLFKLILIGNKSVGKTSILSRFIQGKDYGNSDDAHFKSVVIKVEDERIKLQIWDKCNGASYYQRANAALIVYDITDRNSFNNIKQWNDEINLYQNQYVHRILIGNKLDLNNSALHNEDIVSIDEAKRLAKELDINNCIQVSARTGENVQEAFHIVFSEVYTQYVKREFMPFYG